MLKAALGALAQSVAGNQPRWPLAIAAAVGLAAAAVAVGWLTNTSALAKILPHLPPMPLNTALALLLLAAAWWAVPNHPRRCLALISAATLLAVDCLLGWAMARPTLFDASLQNLLPTFPHVALQTMAPSAATGIVLLAGALPALTWSRTGTYIELVGIAAASATLGLAALAILTIAADWSPQASRTGHSSMPTHTALCIAALALTLLIRPHAVVHSQRVVTRLMATAVPLLLAGAVAGYTAIQARAERHLIADLNSEAARAANSLAAELKALRVASKAALEQAPGDYIESLDLLTDAFPYVVRARRLHNRSDLATVSFAATAGGTRIAMRVPGASARILMLELAPQLLLERLHAAPSRVRARVAVKDRWVPADGGPEHWLASKPAPIEIAGSKLALQLWYPDAASGGAEVPAFTVPALSAVAMLLAWLIAQSAIVRAQGRELALFEATSEAILVTDAAGIIESANGPAFALLRSGEHNLAGRSLKQLLPDLAFTPVAAGIAGTSANRQMLTASTLDGGTLPVEAKVSEALLGGRAFWVVAVRDLTERRQLEREIHTRNTVFDLAMRSSPVGFVMTDKEGSITEYNQAFGQWLGAGELGLIGTPIAAWVSPEHRPALMLACNRLRSRAERSFTLPVLGWRRGAPGRWAKVSAAAIWLDDTGPLDAISMKFIDTDAEQRLTRQLADTNKFLTAKNQELDQFAYIASHDLKEPLRTLRVYSDYLVKDLAADKPERVQQDADFIRKAAARMSGLIDDLLQLSRAGNAPLRCDNVSLDSCLDQALNSLQAACSAAKTEIQRPPQLPWVTGDEQQLVRVFSNLIGNSIKFRDAARPLLITVTCELSEHCWQLTILDNGIGIPPDKTAEVMAPFRRLHSQNEVEGSGIGLAIVSKIIERHGGSVRLEARETAGTAAIIRLPKNNHEATDEHETREPAAG